jgi:hypothetical protein
MAGSLPACCARAANGQPATAPPSNVTNCRRARWHFALCHKPTSTRKPKLQYGDVEMRSDAYLQQQPSHHRNSTSSFRSQKHRLEPSSSTVVVGPKKPCGDRDQFPYPIRGFNLTHAKNAYHRATQTFAHNLGWSRCNYEDLRYTRRRVIWQPAEGCVSPCPGRNRFSARRFAHRGSRQVQNSLPMTGSG